MVLVPNKTKCWWNIIEEESQASCYSADSDNFEIIKGGVMWKKKWWWSTVKSAKADEVIDGTSAVGGGAYKADNNGTPWVNLDVQALDKVLKMVGILLMKLSNLQNASAILAKGGNETSSTFHGHHDFMLSDDIIRRYFWDTTLSIVNHS